MIERNIERALFASRWLMAPFFLGLVVALPLVLLKFVQELIHLAPGVLSMDANSMILAVLGLIDLTLVAALVLMMILAGYENFVSKIETPDHSDRPSWMGHVDFGDLKLKVIGSLVAISAIQLLRAFLEIQDYTTSDLGWLVGIHLTFVVSGVLLALMDRIAEGGGKPKH